MLANREALVSDTSEPSGYHAELATNVDSAIIQCWLYNGVLIAATTGVWSDVRHSEQLLNENLENAITFCFDLQQVQSMPRVPISKTFYAQQLLFYAFCVTDVTTRHPVFYTWTENQAFRGCLATKNWREDPELQGLLAVFPPDLNHHEDTNSQGEDDDEDVCIANVTRMMRT
ncbi:hypothetical protein ILUMI_24938 [Ignelater luminosus]|uniref:Uncharacterized protein n=1 Tax=Ignelater luminosus TaxID=2038154 RepID=A0A8K0G0E7_IGNLU|nr:hypothetical protein ILUMI_24938 [Ignelater luminosus]